MKFSVEQILNLPGIKVLNCQDIEGLGLIIEIQADSKSSKCPRCGKASHSIHQNHWRNIKDLPWSNQQVILRVNRRQFRCKNCQKPFSEDLDFVDKQRGYTKRFAIEIVKQVLDSNIRSVAERNDLSESEIQSMLDYLESDIRLDLSEIKRLGIDEIALIKGQGNYLGVLVDLDRRKPIDIVESRRQSEMSQALQSMGNEVLEQIEEVSIDLWKPYKSLVKELMPNADVTVDRFHVMKQVNDELDATRKQQKKAAGSLKNKLEKDRILAGLLKSKYSLLKNEDSLNELQKEKLKAVQDVSPILSKMHALKEEFRNIFNTAESWGDEVLKLLDWMYDSSLYFPKTIRTIFRWFGDIVGYFEQRTTSGTVEGINNKLKLLKRLGYGFRNFANFRLRCLLSWHFSVKSP
ncbi:ISL3 family transposase [Nostoc sp. CHAB 5715]|uniref:ISL3 family transposase n=1 Tax=Nostoc sp. CHAB 5715 TaxID=2780400 RepID=UPI001E58B0E0|nr:ISL3 family transposase [Nostoc sp. CHAB 5715]MCC5620850.1 ISL3 family transposase [Nostoc sp. CHAB 5715]